MILERVPLNLGNYSDFYWKGEGLFVDLKNYPNKIQILELYQKLEQNQRLKKKDYLFLRLGFSDIYSFFDSIVSQYKKLGDYSNQLLMLLLRTKCFALDIEEKLQDDVKLSKSLVSNLPDIFKIPNIFNPHLKLFFPEGFCDHLPQRFSSTTMLYLIAISLNAKRVVKYSNVKKVDCSFIFRDSFFVTFFEVQGELKVDKEKFLVESDKDPLSKIISNLFSSNYYQNYNQGVVENNGKSYFWFAWMV